MREWMQVPAVTVKVGDQIIRSANQANYTCVAVEPNSLGWVILCGSISGVVCYTEAHRAGDLVWVRPKD